MVDDFDVSRISTLTDGQEITLYLLGVFAGALSVVGSSSIVYKVISDRAKAAPHDRLMLGLSSCDIVASISYAMSPFLLPQDTSQRVWARGTDGTCTFLGFLTQFSFSAIVYNMMLSFYYLLTVRFGVKRAQFAKRYEFWMHAVTLLFFLVTASAGLVFGMYSEFDLGYGCWVNEYPKGCEETDTCVSQYIGWGFGAVPTLITFLSLTINNLVICCYVRHTLGPTRSTTRTSASTSTSSADSMESDLEARQRTQTREVAWQGVLYVGTFFLCYTPAFAVRLLESLDYMAADEAGIYPLMVINAFLLPLQGFFNMFVYNRLNYVRVKAAFPEQSTFWVLRKACLDTDIPRLKEISKLSTKSKSKSGFGGSKLQKNSASGFSSHLDLLPEGIQEGSHEGSSHEGSQEESSMVDDEPSSTDRSNSGQIEMEQWDCPTIPAKTENAVGIVTPMLTHDLNLLLSSMEGSSEGSMELEETMSVSSDDSMGLEESMNVFRLEAKRISMDGSIRELGASQLWDRGK
jgi:hypothetical protein